MLAKVAIIYLVVINALAFLLMGIDKYKAKKNISRIAEKSLFVVVGLFGSIGIWTGMYFFHHKTKKWLFVLGVPLVLVAQVILALYILKK